MNKWLLTCTSAALSAATTFTATHAQEVEIGVLLGFTDPAETIFPPIAMAAKLAIKEASDSGAFLNGSTVISVRGDSTCTDNNAAAERLVTADGVKAIMGAGSSDSQVFKTHVMDVANAPGEVIYPGELAKGLEILAAGGEIDYAGASGVELIGPGESSGSYREFIVEGGKIVTVQYH